MAVKYFIFSKEQLDHRTAIEAKMGNKYIPGEVIVKGLPKRFTELNNTGVSRFSDAIIVLKAETTITKYTDPTTD